MHHKLLTVLLISFCLNSVAIAGDLPGTNTFPEKLKKTLQQSLASKGNQYKPRTRHLDNNGNPKYTNRLIFEDSPYLLQHAHNPVDWFPWDDEAFARARQENKPVFLSIGYSTCHWRHVMEKESFEDIEIAEFLNKHFVSIKVDRERRPDVDELYMTALMLVKGQGGWPISCFLLPDGTPFYVDSYLPPEAFLTLLKEISKAWEQRQNKITEYADEIKAAVTRVMQEESNIKELDEDIIQRAVSEILKAYDSTYGGFGVSPKFTNESLLFLLLQVAQRQHDEEIIKVLEHTLSMMARGGIYDHIGGGFHRYATDESWQVPHFEKMLYNQANLARIYCRAYQITGNKFFARIARQTLNYVLRDMGSPEGVFYAATDADVNGHEGAYFLWTKQEVEKILPDNDAKLVIKIFNITETGNFNESNILNLSKSLEEITKQQGITTDELFGKLDDIIKVLLDTRNKREPPLRDEKIIVTWNAMMISALAEASAILDMPDYLASARRSAEFIWKNQMKPDGTLWRINLNGNPSIPGLQEDYAYLIDAMITLYDVTGERQWLDRAQQLSATMSKKFWDDAKSSFAMNERDKSLFTTPRQSRDSVIPSGNSVAVYILSRLSQRLNDKRYKNQALKTIQGFAKSIDQYPAAYAYMLAGFDTLLHGDAGPDEYAANGAIKVSVRRHLNEDTDSLLISLRIAPGWHINTSQPLQDYLIPLQINLSDNNEHWHLTDIKFPEPVYKKLEFDGGRLALYEGVVKIYARLVTTGNSDNYVNKGLDIRLKLQACSNKICLPPEKIKLELPAY